MIEYWVWFNFFRRDILARRKRNHSKDDHKVKEPTNKVQKYSNNPDVQVGSARTLRNRTVVVPDIQPLSKTIVGTTKATKKPNGKGYSKGHYGEKTIMTPIAKSTKRKSVSIVLSDDEIPDLEETNHEDSAFTMPEPLKRTRRKKGSVGTISKKTADAKKKDVRRYINILIFFFTQLKLKFLLFFKESWNSKRS